MEGTGAEFVYVGGRIEYMRAGNEWFKVKYLPTGGWYAKPITENRVLVELL